MKKIPVLFLFILLSLHINAQIKVSNTGKVGVGLNLDETPQHSLEVQGALRIGKYGLNSTWEQVILDFDNQWGAPMLYCKTLNFSLGTSDYPINYAFIKSIHAGGVYTLSDERAKENIQPLNSVLANLLQVNGKSYKLKQDEVNSSRCKREQDSKTTFGFIAQDLQKIFPELVLSPDSINPSYAINYSGMIPVLVEAIKEQQVQITELKNVMIMQENELSALKDDVNTCCSNNSKYKNTKSQLGQTDLMEIKEAKLYQNTPNPFSAETEIKYDIPQNATSAKIIIHNMIGAEIKAYPIEIKQSSGEIIIKGQELTAGIYLYSLVVDNNLIDTKKMLLTK